MASGAVERPKRPAEDSSPDKQPAAKKARMFDLDSFDIDSDLSESSDEDDWSIDDAVELASESDQGGPSDAGKKQAGSSSDPSPAAQDNTASAGVEASAAAASGMTDKVVDGALAEASAPEAERLPAPAAQPPSVLVGDGHDVSAELDLQQYSSAEALEAVGLEQLKQQLMKHGLKCGGTLKDRAARLFLLKDTALERLDKQHFAKAAKK